MRIIFFSYNVLLNYDDIPLIEPFVNSDNAVIPCCCFVKLRNSILD